MTDKNKINFKITELTRQLSENNRDILKKFPVEACINDIKSYPELRNYNYISKKLADMFEDILYHYGLRVFALYNKLLVLKFMCEQVEYLENSGLQDNFHKLYNEWFEDIINGFSIQPDEYYTYKNDPFLKDLAVCASRGVPVGGACIVVISGVERRFLVTGESGRFLEKILFALFHMKGFKPFYYAHLVDRYVSKFNSEERIALYHNIVDLFKKNPEIKGLMGASWFYDPKVAKISPHLAYLTELPLKNGAKIFRIGTTEEDIKNATLKSRTRRKLYEQGKYMPASHYMIWPRKAMIKWADSHKRIYIGHE